MPPKWWSWDNFFFPASGTLWNFWGPQKRPKFWILDIKVCLKKLGIGSGLYGRSVLYLLHNSSVVQCQKIILPNFPTTGCIKKCKGKKANNARHAAHTVQNWYSHWNQSLFEIVSYIPLYLTNIVCSCKVHIFWEGHKGHS